MQIPKNSPKAVIRGYRFSLLYKGVFVYIRPLYSAWPKNRDLRNRGQWTKNFFCLFHTFRWFSTYLGYIPFENAKKSKIGSPYCIKSHSHEMFELYFFHKLTSLRPLVKTQKYFRIPLRIFWDIQPSTVTNCDSLLCNYDSVLHYVAYHTKSTHIREYLREFGTEFENILGTYSGSSEQLINNLR
jgi:hypothetical protein